MYTEPSSSDRTLPACCLDYGKSWTCRIWCFSRWNVAICKSNAHFPTVIAEYLHRPMKPVMSVQCRIKLRTGYQRLQLPAVIPISRMCFRTYQASDSLHAHAQARSTLAHKSVMVATLVEPRLKSMSLKHKCPLRTELAMFLNPYVLESLLCRCANGLK